MITNLPAPFAPLVAGGDGLDRYPSEPRALAARMAEIYGVPADSVLPVRGLTHGLELVFRLAARAGQSVQAPDAEPYRALAALYAPEDKRAGLMALAAFNAEVAGVRDRISQALPGEIRLQWWRDTIASGDDAT